MALILAECATAQIAEQRVVSGRITDQQGRPVPGTPVLVVGRQLDFTTKFDYAERDRRGLKVLTADDGWYRAEFIPPANSETTSTFFLCRRGIRRRPVSKAGRD